MLGFALKTIYSVRILSSFNDAARSLGRAGPLKLGEAAVAVRDEKGKELEMVGSSSILEQIAENHFILNLGRMSCWKVVGLLANLLQFNTKT